MCTCPFCGTYRDPALVADKTESYKSWFYMECLSCHARGPRISSRKKDAIEKAKRAWFNAIL